MITAIREVRRAQGLTLEAVAQRCVPPTTAQTIGRLETGTRTVSMAWLQRIAAALGVDAADLVRLPDRPDLPVAAVLDGVEARAPRRAASIVPPAVTAGLVAVNVVGGAGDYRAGDAIWLQRLAPAAFTEALGRDVLAPAAAGGFRFGRLLAVEADAIRVLPPGAGTTPVRVPMPAWIGRAVRLVRPL